mmetsp:Transcript_12883/g.30672  ORF Transcript_12883/g.30672 Transcript_12883/m.30672 type:complete len:179 (-) Transcript_12883:60-596(-)|eukprot:CAMPEP_0177718934 /NCGR_PEP_ID=MMETSP0484_2-20121128/15841_1 /TAXON_ID=354590 /ORGANISM="Rhodomonas lens, Strain RHODO" /LENGTH=178 /DNA_ID=CAMNT_0019231131 /DNA_START=144 /DNA_END=680 /DNA_ORIENTATION=+
MASDLFRLVNKVQEKAKEVTDGVGDGLQRVANKTEDLTKRVNRTVNPFSSHFGSGSNQSSPAAGSSERYRSNSEDVTTPSRSDSGLAPELARRSSKEEVSSKAVTIFAESVRDAVHQEIQSLEREKEEHLAVLKQLEALQAEQETAYREAEERMAQREEEMRAAIKMLESSSGYELQF